MSTVFVTGAASGIGRATVDRLADRGHRVVGFDVDADGLATLESRSNVETHVGDITDEARVREVLEGYDRLDALVNCAATYELAAVADVGWDALEAQFRVNVFGTHVVTRAALPALRESGGRVVTLSSVLGRASMPLHGAYAGTKHALEGLFDALRAEEAEIDVVLVEPGAVETGFNERARAGLDGHGDSYHAALYDRVRERYDPGGVPPGTVADVVVSAIETDDPRARYVATGQARILLACRALLPEWLYDRLVRSRVRNSSAGRGALELVGGLLADLGRAVVSRVRSRF